MNNILLGNTNFIGDLCHIDTNNTKMKSSIIGLNIPSTAGKDAGIMIERNYDDITDYQYTGVIVATPSLTEYEINETVETGWLIQVGTEKRKIIGVAGNIITTEDWINPPDVGNIYYLYRNIYVAMIYKPAINSLQFGFTHNKYTDNIINVAGITNNLQSLAFNLVDNVSVNSASFITVATFVWLQNEYGAFTAGKLLFYLTGNISVNFNNETLNIIHGTGNFSTGFHVLAVTLPTANSLINLQLKGTGFLRSISLKL